MTGVAQINPGLLLTAARCGATAYVLLLGTSLRDVDRDDLVAADFSSEGMT